ncbi:MAG: two-component system sensor histidine kinase NtrB [Fimbriiglobus sp.]
MPERNSFSEAMFADLFSRIEQLENLVRGQIGAGAQQPARIPHSPRPTDRTEVIDNSSIFELPPYGEESRPLESIAEETTVSKETPSRGSIPIAAIMRTPPAPLSQDFLRQTALDISSRAIVGLDQFGTVQEWNTSAVELFGWRKDEVVGRPPPHIPTETLVEFESIIRQPRNHSEERLFLCSHKSGQSITVKFSVKGSPCGGTVMAYREVPLSNDSLPDPRPAMLTPPPRRHPGEAVQPGEYPMIAIARAALGMAHDFNNTLSVLQGYAELLREYHLPGSEAHELATTIISTSEMFGRICRHLMSIQRPEVGSPLVADASQIVLQSARLIRGITGVKVRVTVMPAEESFPMCHITPGEFFQILLNLVTNAADAMRPHGGSLTVSTGRRWMDGNELGWPKHLAHGDFVVLSVQDTGPGIDSTILPKLFQPGFTTRQETNHGIGLTTIRDILNRVHGHITHESTSQGTTFHVFLREAH